MTEPKSCPRCGAGLSAPEVLQGLCAGCLLVAGLESKVEGEPAPKRPAPAIEALAPHFPELEILELVGQGGMGSVYRVRQKKLERLAALKILALDGEATPAFAERFEREARTLASLSHENIVAVYDCGRAGPHWYLLMEYVEGVSLRQMIRAREVDPRHALGLVAQICDALQFAHDHGIVHRDVKPENVLVDRRGRVKILDFGLAKLLGQEPRTGTLTETGQVLGTPRYMAPEQWERPLTVDHRADIYAVGVVFYELLTGELPIGAFQLPSQLSTVDARIDPVVMKTLAKEPDRRYQHASDVRTDVQRIASAPPLPVAPPHRRRWGPAWIAVGAVGCLLFAALPIAFLFYVGVARSTSQLAAQDARRAAEQAAAEQAALQENIRTHFDQRLQGHAPGELTRTLMRDSSPGPQIDVENARRLGWDELQLRLGPMIADALWRIYHSLHQQTERTTVIKMEGSHVVLRTERGREGTTDGDPHTRAWFECLARLMWTPTYVTGTRSSGDYSIETGLVDIHLGRDWVSRDHGLEVCDVDAYERALPPERRLSLADRKRRAQELWDLAHLDDWLTTLSDPSQIDLWLEQPVRGRVERGGIARDLTASELEGTFRAFVELAKAKLKGR